MAWPHGGTAKGLRYAWGLDEGPLGSAILTNSLLIFELTYLMKGYLLDTSAEAEGGSLNQRLRAYDLFINPSHCVHGSTAGFGAVVMEG